MKRINKRRFGSYLFALAIVVLIVSSSITARIDIYGADSDIIYSGKDIESIVFYNTTGNDSILCFESDTHGTLVLCLNGTTGNATFYGNISALENFTAEYNVTVNENLIVNEGSFFRGDVMEGQIASDPEVRIGHHGPWDHPAIFFDDGTVDAWGIDLSAGADTLRFFVPTDVIMSLTTTQAIIDVDLDITGDVDATGSIFGNDITLNQFITGLFGGSIDLSGDPWYLSGTSFQIAENLTVDHDGTFTGDVTASNLNIADWDTAFGRGDRLWNRSGTTLYPATNNDTVQVNATLALTNSTHTWLMYIDVNGTLVWEME